MSAFITIIKYLIAIFFVLPFGLFIGLLFVLPIIWFLQGASLVFLLGSVVVASVIWFLRDFLNDAFENVLGFLVDDQPLWKSKADSIRKQPVELVENTDSESGASSGEALSGSVSSYAVGDGQPDSKLGNRKLVAQEEEVLSQEGGFQPHINVQELHLVTDRKKIISLITEKPSYLAWIKDEFRSDQTIVLEAIARDSSIVRFASNSLKKDKQFNRECWSRCPDRGSYAYYASQLKAPDQPTYREALLATIKERKHTEFLLDRPLILRENSEFCDDLEIVKAALEHDPRNISFISTNLREDESVVDKSLVLKAIKNRKDSWLLYKGEMYGPFYNSYFKRFVPDRLQDDKDILMAIDQEVGHCADEWGIW